MATFKKIYGTKQTKTKFAESVFERAKNWKKGKQDREKHKQKNLKKQ